MKKDLLIGGAFVVLAMVGAGVVVFVLGSQEDPAAPKTIKPRVEPIAALPAVREEPKKSAKIYREIPLKHAEERKEKEPRETEIKKDDAKAVAKAEPEKKAEEKAVAKVDVNIGKKKAAEKVIANADVKIDKKKDAEKVVAKADVNIDKKKDAAKVLAKLEIDKKEKGKPWEVIEMGEIKSINRPDGEYIVNHMAGADAIILVGKVKTLKLNGAHGRALIDASKLTAQEIVFTGDIAGSAVVKLNAPKGVVAFQAQISGSAQVEINAEGGKVVFKSTNNGPIAAAGSKLAVTAKDVELNGEVLGGVVITLTLTRDGSLKFSKLAEGVQLRYGKADAADPELRLDKGAILGGAKLQKLDAPKR